MPLDPYLADRLPLLDGLAYPLDAEQAARMAAFEEDPGPWSLPEGIDVVAETASGPHGPVPLRVYSPAAPERALLWVHGGGFAAGSVDMRESHVVAAELADRARARVVSVDYRLAGPDVRYPVPLDDVHAAWRHLRSTQAGSTPVAIGGASAGPPWPRRGPPRARCRRAAAGARAPGLPFAHFPNPAVDDAIAAELRELPPVLRFPPSSIEGMVRTYLGRISDLPVEALPGSAPLAGLPPVTVLVNEYDELRGSAELLLRQLAEAGVAVTGHLAAGMPHGHLNRTPALPEVDRSLHLFAAQLRAMG